MTSTRERDRYVAVVDAIDGHLDTCVVCTDGNGCADVDELLGREAEPWKALQVADPVFAAAYDHAAFLAGGGL